MAPCPMQVLYRTVSINVFKGEDVQDSIEEVVPYRCLTEMEGNT